MSIETSVRPTELHWFAGLSIASLAIGFAATLSANALFHGHTRPLSDGMMPLTVLTTVLMAWLIWRAWGHRSTVARTAIAVIACIVVPQHLYGVSNVFSHSTAIGAAALSATVMQVAGVLLTFCPAASAWFADTGGKA